MSDTNQQDEAYQPKQPHIRGITCPACGSHDSIFIGTGGYLTCSWVECPEPELEAAIQKHEQEAIAAAVVAARINSLLDLEQWAKIHDLDGQMIFEGIEHMVSSLLQTPNQPMQNHSDRIAQLQATQRKEGV